MKHGSLFSGIGGFDLAAEWMGWENVFHCEWNEFGQKVLKYYWPNAEIFDDITKTDFTKYANKIDILSGGFPCQPYSSAGKRLGKNDERHLWPEMLRAIREIAPRYVVGENVRGLINWNGGLVFDEVCTELENLGYKVAPYIIPASGVNAPHRRERIWFIAYRDGERNGTKHEFCSRGNVPEEWVNKCGNASDTECIRLEHTKETGNIHSDPKGLCEKRHQSSQSIETNGRDGDATHPESFGGLRFGNGSREVQFGRGDWSGFPTQSPVCRGDDGLPTKLDGITFSKWRAESIKAYGNAVVPQVVYEIFKAIEKNENL